MTQQPHHIAIATLRETTAEEHQTTSIKTRNSEGEKDATADENQHMTGQILIATNESTDRVAGTGSQS